MKLPVVFLANSKAGSDEDVILVVNASRFTEGNFSQPQRSLVFKDKAGQLMNVAFPEDWRASVTPEMLANTSAHPHFFDYCRTDIVPKSGIDDPAAFCAWLHKQVEGVWPTEAANGRLEYVGNSVEYKHGKDGWVQVSPYGRFAHEKGDQVFERSDAEEIVNTFNDAANFPQRAMGIPWYIGHPDHGAFQSAYPDRRAYGRIKRMEARPDGLWANVRWSSDGKKLIEDQAFHGHSVNWGVVKRGGIWRPVALKSVGFTNEPNIPVLPVMMSNERTNQMKKDEVCKLLGLDPATATDEQIQAKITSTLANERSYLDRATKAEAKVTELTNLANEKKAVEDKVIVLTTDLTNERTGRKTDVEAERAKVTAKETELANERKAHVKSVLDMAVIGGCITIAQRPQYEAEFANSHEATLTKVLGLKPTVKTMTTVGRKDQRLGVPAERREMFLANVRKRMKDDGLDYNTAYNMEQKEHPELLTTTT